MKLNKILALALTGVMAVSMLAGCGNKDTGNGDGDVVVTPTTSDAASVMNDEQDDVVFANSADLLAALKVAADKAKVADIKDAKYEATQLTTTSGANVFNAMSSKVVGLTANALSHGTSGFGANLTAESKSTLSALYMVKSNGLSEEQALKMVAEAMNSDGFVDTTGDLDAEYNGVVSIVKATAADEDDSYEAYVIAVSITQTVTENSKNNT